jgi:hypothetical protein
MPVLESKTTFPAFGITLLNLYTIVKHILDSVGLVKYRLNTAIEHLLRFFFLILV